jgi:hypothetical protein
MAIMLDGTQLVNTSVKPTTTTKKVTYTPPKTTKPAATTQSNSYYLQYIEQQKAAQRAAEQRAAYEAAQQRQQAQYQTYQEQMRQQTEAARLQAQQAEYQRLQEQKQFNQQRTPVTSNLQPIPVNGGVNFMEMGRNQFTPNMQVRNYIPPTNMNMYAQPDRWATTPQAMQQIQNYQQTPQPDRWATGPAAQKYVNNYLAYRKQQEDEYNMLRKTAWQNGPAANFLFQGLGPPVPPGFYENQNAPAPDYGGYGDYGYGDYNYNPPNYSGGGGGYTYEPKPPEWWVEMVNWRI